MRDIKFRYRLKLISVEWGMYEKGDIATFFFNLNNESNGLHRFSIDERWEVVSRDEYTGLKDRNGIDVYEGDVVEYNDGVKVNVIFKDGCFCGYDGYAASSDEAYTLLVPEETPFNSFDFEIKVVGNIHENPELLEVK